MTDLYTELCRLERRVARLAKREPRGLLQPRLLRGQQRSVHIAVRITRLRCSITLLPCPHETGCEVIPRPANEGMRVREQGKAHGGTLCELVARNHAKVRPVLLRLQNRRLPLPRQILEGAGLEQRLVELAPLRVVHLAERRIADDLLDAAAQLSARHRRRPYQGQRWSRLLLCMESRSVRVRLA